jgi:hypothetical protein
MKNRKKNDLLPCKCKQLRDAATLSKQESAGAHALKQRTIQRAGGDGERENI